MRFAKGRGTCFCYVGQPEDIHFVCEKYFDLQVPTYLHSCWFYIRPEVFVAVISGWNARGFG